jgi:Family of unknown function (DUF6494)
MSEAHGNIAAAIDSGVETDQTSGSTANCTSPINLEGRMNEDALNLSIRKFLKMVGISSQREIEHAVAKLVEAGTVSGTDSFPAKMTLEIPGLKVNVAFSGDIAIQ